MSRVSVKLKRTSRYKDVSDQYLSQSKRAVFLGCEEIRTIAVNGIKDGIKTGKKYPRGGKTHTASAAGEYPAADLGNLDGNINTNILLGGLVGIVESKAAYSSSLEFGTSRMAARPFMLPSAVRARPFIRKKFRELKAR